MEIIARNGEVILVSNEDYKNLSEYKWHINSKGYATCHKDTKSPQSMSRMIMGFPDGMVVDHINGNKLDNRRENLRICSQAENVRNHPGYKKDTASKYKGVFLYKRPGYQRWRAVIKKDYKFKHIGYFPTEVEAARAYDKVAVEIFGEYAKTNF